MAGRQRRPPFDTKAGFRKPGKDGDGGNAIKVIIQQARKSGQLNLSNRALNEVPSSVWRINIDVPEEGKSVSLDNTEDRWWEQVDLNKLILASNTIQQLSEDIHLLPALTVLDVHDNALSSLPEALTSLVNLQRLNISHNKISVFPEHISRLINLRVLLATHNQFQEIKENLCQLYYLEELNLSHNQLTSLPPKVGYLSKLVTFSATDNQIQELPREIGCMNCLQTLDFTHNQLGSLPEEVGQLAHLRMLYLRHNKLTHIPLLTACEKLKEIQLGNNAIKELTPAHLEPLQAIAVLDLRDNKISVLPDEIVLLQGLERLDLTNNDLSTLPYALGTLVNLKSIVLEGNSMKGIRRDIMMRGTNELKKYLMSRMEEVPSQTNGVVKATQGHSGIIGGGGGLDPYAIQSTKTLQYSEKKVGEIPEEVWTAVGSSDVNTVDFSKNALSQWPERLMSMSQTLADLNLGFNRLAAVSADVGQFTKLVNLDLRNNMLSGLPSEMVALKLLREITLSNNRLKEMPAVLYQLPKLEILLASGNQIGEINVDGLKQLQMLATLDLQNNDIRQVPPELGNCEQLRSLQLAGNPFRQPRPAVLDKGTTALMEYLRDRIPRS